MAGSLESDDDVGEHEHAGSIVDFRGSARSSAAGDRPGSIAALTANFRALLNAQLRTVEAAATERFMRDLALVRQSSAQDHLLQQLNSPTRIVRGSTRASSAESGAISRNGTKLGRCPSFAVSENSADFNKDIDEASGSTTQEAMQFATRTAKLPITEPKSHEHAFGGARVVIRSPADPGGQADEDEEEEEEGLTAKKLASLQLLDSESNGVRGARVDGVITILEHAGGMMQQHHNHDGVKFEDDLEHEEGPEERASVAPTYDSMPFVLDSFWTNECLMVSRQSSESSLFSEGDLRPTASMFLRPGHRFPLNPESSKRLVWIGLGILLIGYDLAHIPLSLAGLLPELVLFDIMEMVGLCFWSADIIMSFITGYQEDGVLIMSFKSIALKYIRGWFGIDLLIVMLDLLLILSDEISKTSAGDAASMARSARIMRVVRTLRLFRLMRIGKFIEVTMSWIDNVSSEVTLMILKAARLVLFIVVLNHYLACMWYGIAHYSGEDRTWLGDKMDDKFEYYIAAFHWALTQFSPATQNIGPENIYERVFASCVVLVALVTFSTFLSKMTSAMTQLLSFNSARVEEESRLRRFFGQCQISPVLRQRIWRCYRKQSGIKKARMCMQEVEYFSQMPERLQLQLRKELYTQSLKLLPIFAHTILNSSREMLAVCKGMQEHTATTLHEIFQIGSMAEDAICITHGSLEYKSRATVEKLEVGVGDWVCEAALWGWWRRRGLLTSMTSSRWLSLKAEVFRETLVLVGSETTMRRLRRYAAVFQARVGDGVVLDVSQDKDRRRSMLATSVCTQELWFDGESELPVVGRLRFLAGKAWKKLLRAARCR